MLLFHYFLWGFARLSGGEDMGKKKERTKGDDLEDPLPTPGVIFRKSLD